jgi:hypothetical protein
MPEGGVDFLLGLTLAITWPPRAKKFNKDHQGAAQVYGIVGKPYTDGRIKTFTGNSP